MKQLLIITLLMLCSGPLYADWVAVERNYLSPSTRTVYVDADSSSSEGNLVRIWQLTDYKWIQGNVGFGRLLFGTPAILIDKDP